MSKHSESWSVVPLAMFFYENNFVGILMTPQRKRKKTLFTQTSLSLMRILSHFSSYLPLNVWFSLFSISHWMEVMRTTWTSGTSWAKMSQCSIHLIVYSIFALYRDTENIHSIMMIWLVIFIISNYNLASGPPKDPGGVKKHIFKIKGHWFIEFSP